MKTIILHIGLPKTGTTFIQQSLARNRDRLLDESERILQSADVDILKAFARDYGYPYHLKATGDLSYRLPHIVGLLGCNGYSVARHHRYALCQEVHFDWPRLELDQPAKPDESLVVGISRDDSAPDFPKLTFHLEFEGQEDFSSVGAALAADFHQAVPDAFEGFEVAACFGSKARSIRVRSMDEFFMDETGGHREMPADVAEWNPTSRDESHLYFLKHGHVFHDPLGEFSRRREAFCQWPRHTLLKRIGNTAWQLWHYGEYNFDRVARREDPLAILFCKAEFIHHAMRLCFYLEEDFVPYWKWVSHCFRRIEGIAGIADMLDEFNAATEIAVQKQLVESLCAALCSRVIEKGYVAAKEVGDGSPLEVYNRLEQMSEQAIEGRSA